MKTILALAAMSLGLATGAMAHVAPKTAGYVYTFPQTGHAIHVSCFRGPWKEVIWDRPNAIFLDDLHEIGYDYATARAIGERICRDATLVGHPDGMKAEMLKIYYDSAVYLAKPGRKLILH
ncbi:hypothetical protein ACRARG_14340 [Pseudooceanicola sp. C21-150M6]|uniref:hypothetical protein n=1 Tax=Pseudooceanicola sp. C21-150M6 TaxID=3434355 RepID=UPI003D7F6852